MKAILIIDLPRMCADCPMFTWVYSTDIECEEGFCTHTHELVHYNERPLDCPLKPIPQKKSIELACQKEDEGNDYGAGMIVGWNDCIKEITE